jgi:acyl dehydratase
MEFNYDLWENVHLTLFLEYLAIGNEYHSKEHRLDIEQIVNFARQFDPQPFHLDEEAAQASLFHGLAASAAGISQQSRCGCL